MNLRRGRRVADPAGLESTMPIMMEGTKPIIMNMEGTPPLRGVPYQTF